MGSVLTQVADLSDLSFSQKSTKHRFKKVADPIYT